MAEIICGVRECRFNDEGDCTAERVEIDTKLNAAGFQQICQTYEEE